MPNIFKTNIAKKIATALNPLVFEAVLTKKASEGLRADNPTGGIDSSSKAYTGKGYVDSYREFLVDGHIIQQGDRKIVLLGASFPVEPEPGDSILIEGRTRLIVNVVRDPAGATFECQAR